MVQLRIKAAWRGHDSDQIGCFLAHSIDASPPQGRYNDIVNCDSGHRMIQEPSSVAS